MQARRPSFRRRLLAVSALAACAALGCASLRVHVDYDPDEDFSVLRTFAWFPREKLAHTDLSPDLVKVVRPTIEKILAQEGYTRAPREQADFYVLYHLSVERRLDTRTINAPYRGGMGTTGEWEVHRTVREEVTVEYAEGTLVIDVLDTRLRRLVWRGTTSRRLPPNPQAQVVEDAVAAVLASFPPGG